LCLYTFAVAEKTTYELEGRVALVTGASRGIGFAIAEALAARGCSLVITARKVTSVEEAATKLAAYDARVAPYECDIRDEVAVQRLFTFVADEFGHLDFLINNAGIYGPARSVGETDAEGWRAAIDTNLTGTFLCTRYGLPLMKAGSVIVNNLSIAAYQVFPNSAAYIASKMGALGLTNATREDVRKHGIRVMALVPGATDTEIWNQFWPDAPRQKMVQPQEVALAVLNALMLPAGTSVDEIRIMPAGGAL
jgi:NAD(P)-dependent dehydrogenase (short-subunit alcohol dehydrogenase family)